MSITDEYMQEQLGQAKAYTGMLLRMTEKGGEEGAGQVVWEHGRRNFELRAAGKMPLICPATDESDWAGLAVFDAPLDEVDSIMREDPGVKAGVFTYELHPVMGFPGSALG